MRKRAWTDCFDLFDFAFEILVLCMILDVFCACSDADRVHRPRATSRGG